MSGTHEHLEHAEHAHHHAHSSFDRKVAVTMAIVAAMLAGVSMFGHRTHNEVLRLQGEAGVLEVNASNGFAWYQATRVRQQNLQISIATAEMQADPATPELKAKREKTLADWRAKVDEYKGDLEKRLTEAKEAKSKAAVMTDKSHLAHKRADRLDIAHLAVEVGLVLCSIAVLTKRRIFWAFGGSAALVGVVVAASAYMITDSHHGDQHGTTQQEGAKH